MLPLRSWPTALWVAAVAAVLLLAHAVGLAIQLALLAADGQMPSQSEWYVGQVLTGSVPALLALGVGLYAARLAMRQPDERLVRSGWVFAIALGVLAVAVVSLSLPLAGLG